MRVDDVVTELLADISAHGMREVILVGHSQAGTILPRLVDRQPNLFRRPVYISCIAPCLNKVLSSRWGVVLTVITKTKWVGDSIQNPLSHPSAYSRMFCNDMTEAETMAFIAKLGHDAWPVQTMMTADWNYAHLSEVPSTYAICLRDGVLPVSWQEVFATRLKVQRKVFIDAGHQVMSTRPHTLAEVLRLEV